MRDTRTHGRFYATVGVMCDRYRRDAPPAYFVWKSTEVQSPQSAERPEVHTCDNSAQTHYSRPEVLWLPSHLYRKATPTPTHTRETHTRTHTHTTQTPLFSLLTANLSKRGAVGGGG